MAKLRKREKMEKEIRKVELKQKNIPENKDAVVTQIMSTNDYSKFNFKEGNRKINNRNYFKLLESMKQEQLMIPILVNEQFEIIDGQHRFQAAKELNLPIFYFIVDGYGSEEMKRANLVSSNWTKDDFLNMFLADGDKRYEAINSIIENYEVPISLVLKAISAMQNNNQKLISKQFEEGTIELKHLDAVIEFFDALEDFSFFKPYKTLQFSRAFLKLYMAPEYDHEIMKQRLEKRKNYIVKKNTVDDYLVMLTKEVYSFGPTRQKLFYDKENKTFYN